MSVYLVFKRVANSRTSEGKLPSTWPILASFPRSCVRLRIPGNQCTKKLDVASPPCRPPRKRAAKRFGDFGVTRFQADVVAKRTKRDKHVPRDDVCTSKLRSTERERERPKRRRHRQRSDPRGHGIFAWPRRAQTRSKLRTKAELQLTDRYAFAAEIIGVIEQRR